MKARQTGGMAVSIFSKIESTIQNVVEGTFGWVIRTRLQPAELASKLRAAMEANLTVNADGRIAPNIYNVQLSDKDFENFTPYLATLGQQLANILIRHARDRHYTLTTRPVVKMTQGKDIVTGQVRITTQLVDNRTAQSQGAALMEETRSITAAEAGALQQQAVGAATIVAPLAPAWLTTVAPVSGQPLRVETPVVHMGRSGLNEVVIDDKKASRRHAEIKWEHGQYVLYDLASMNGTRVNGVRITGPTTLRDGDRVSVGRTEIVFQRRG